MKRREQALLFLHKAAQDEALVEQVLSAEAVSDEVVGFHCQQAAEKMLKALLSDLGVRFRKTHDLGTLAELLSEAGYPLPKECAGVDVLTPFGAVYRYEDYDSDLPLDRERARAMLRLLRHWVESHLRARPAGEQGGI